MLKEHYIHWINYYPLGSQLRYLMDRDLSSVVYCPPFGLRSFLVFFRYTGNGELELKQVKTSQKLSSTGNQQNANSNTRSLSFLYYGLDIDTF